MANKTTNYGLTKPLPEEFYDVNVQNSNMDIIDEALKTLSEDSGVMISEDEPESGEIWIDTDDESDTITPEKIGASKKAVTFTVTLTKSGWSNKTQTVANSHFVAIGYCYTISPESGSFLEYGKAQIYAADITTDGNVVFYCCGNLPSVDLVVNVCRVEVSE